MGWRTIYISQSERMSLYLDSLVIIKNNEEYKIPLNDISSIIIEDNKLSITVKLMNKLVEYNILLVFCDDKYNPISLLMPTNSYFRQFKVVSEQLNWNGDVKDFLWKEIIKSKLKNQMKILEKTGKTDGGYETIKKYLNEITLGDVTNREGLAAKIYFRELFGKDFTRSNNYDAINSALNYGYTIFNSKLSRIIASKGLLTYVGIHHKNEYNQFNLSSDLIEVFRPLVDYFVFTYMKHTKYFSREDRIELINLLNTKIKYNGSYETISNVMEKYTEFIIYFFNTGVFQEYKIPSLNFIKFYEL